MTSKYINEGKDKVRDCIKYYVKKRPNGIQHSYFEVGTEEGQTRMGPAHFFDHISGNFREAQKISEASLSPIQFQKPNPLPDAPKTSERERERGKTEDDEMAFFSRNDSFHLQRT